jgi:predicted DNA-binding transcriptional regulator AlpA
MSLPLPDRLLTMLDLIDLFCASRKTIERWVALGKLPRPFKVGRKNLWEPAAIKRALQQLADAQSQGGN